MSWFKKQISKFFSNDIDDDEYYEEKETHNIIENDTENEENHQTKRSSFRFPLIADEELEGKRVTHHHEEMHLDNRSYEGTKKSYAFDVLKPTSKATMSSRVYDVEVSGIRQLLEKRQNRKEYSSIRKSRITHPKDISKIESTVVQKSLNKNKESQKQAPPEEVEIIKKKFTPTKVPSPVYGFSKPSSINELLLKRGEGERPLNTSSDITVEQETERVHSEKEETVENRLTEVLLASEEVASTTVMTADISEESLQINDENMKNSFIDIEDEPIEQKPVVLQSELYENVEEFPILAEEVIERTESQSDEVELTDMKENNIEGETLTLHMEPSPIIEQPTNIDPQAEQSESNKHMETVQINLHQTVQINLNQDEDELTQEEKENIATEDKLVSQEIVKENLDDEIIEQKETFEALDEYIENKTDEFAQQDVVKVQQLANDLIDEEMGSISEEMNKEELVEEEKTLVNNVHTDFPKEIEEEAPKSEQRSKGSTLPFNVLMLKSDKEKLAAKLGVNSKKEVFQSLLQQTTNGTAVVQEDVMKVKEQVVVDEGIQLAEEIVSSIEKREEGELEPLVEEQEALQLEDEVEQKIEHQEFNQLQESQLVVEREPIVNVQSTDQQIEKVQLIVKQPEESHKIEQLELIVEEEEKAPIKVYMKPPIEYLSPPEEKTEDREWMESQGEVLVEALSHFQVTANIESIMQGPAVTQFEITVAHGTKVSKIRNLADDLKLALAAKDIRIQAPIPGKSTIGIEIPNRISRAVRLSEVTNSEAFEKSESPLEAALGLDLTGKPVTIDLRKMPHGLVAGATGSGKSVFINSILVSLLYKADPHELKLMLIDPKMVELAPFNHIPHLVSPVITDVKAATAALKWAVEEMERRYQLFAHVGVRDLSRYNKLCDSNEEHSKKLPYILIVIDELADLMMMSPADVEEAICRIAQKARACGIHLILATQRPSVDVITGLIKSNIPTRIAFAVSSQIDSRTILDAQGAERLLGRGDMLYLGNGMSAPIRIQGTFVTDDEIEEIIDYVRQQGEPDYIFEQEELLKKVEMVEEQDELFEEVCRFVFEQGSASTSSIQRKYHIGYNRAARLIDMLEKNGFVSEQRGSKPREVFITESDLSSMFD